VLTAFVKVFDKTLASITLLRPLVSKKSWVVSFRLGVLEITHGKRAYRFPTDYLLPCMYFGFEGLYIKTAYNDWELDNF
jgi:hypothetical protein